MIPEKKGNSFPEARLIAVYLLTYCIKRLLLYEKEIMLIFSNCGNANKPMDTLANINFPYLTEKL